MPTKIKQHYNKLVTKGLRLCDIAHTDLRHHHIACIVHKGKVLSWGYNVKSCLLRRTYARERFKEKQRDKNSSWRSRRYKKGTKRQETPSFKVMPYRNPIKNPPKFRQCSRYI